MTPAISAAERAGIEFQVHAYPHDPKTEGYGIEAADKLGVSRDRVFKTLIAKLGRKQLAVAILPVSTTLDLKALARVASVKKAVMADKVEVERTTGYVVGGVSPLGQRKPLNTYIDASSRNHDRILVSAGRRGLEIELAPDDLCRLTRGTYALIASE